MSLGTYVTNEIKSYVANQSYDSTLMRGVATKYFHSIRQYFTQYLCVHGMYTGTNAATGVTFVHPVEGNISFTTDPQRPIVSSAEGFPAGQYKFYLNIANWFSTGLFTVKPGVPTVVATPCPVALAATIAPAVVAMQTAANAISSQLSTGILKPDTAAIRYLDSMSAIICSTMVGGIITPASVAEEASVGTIVVSTLTISEL